VGGVISYEKNLLAALAYKVWLTHGEYLLLSAFYGRTAGHFADDYCLNYADRLPKLDLNCRNPCEIGGEVKDADKIPTIFQ
jgi:hypothetical protein